MPYDLWDEIDLPPAQHEAARSKKPEAFDAQPSQQRMRAGVKPAARRNISPSEQKVRRQQARQQGQTKTAGIAEIGGMSDADLKSFYLSISPDSSYEMSGLKEQIGAELQRRGVDLTSMPVDYFAQDFPDGVPMPDLTPAHQNWFQRHFTSKESSMFVTAATPSWLADRVADPYGTPNKAYDKDKGEYYDHPFWAAHPPEVVGRYKIIQVDGMWYGYDTSQNMWTVGFPDKQKVLDMAARPRLDMHAQHNTNTQEMNGMDSSTFAQKEAALLQRMASAPTAFDQDAARQDLDTLRNARREAQSMDGMLDYDAAMNFTGSGLATDALPPMSHAQASLGRTASAIVREGSGDWLDDIETLSTTSAADRDSAMRTEATSWYSAMHPSLRNDREEFSVQARSAGVRLASQYVGAEAEAYVAFLDSVDHIHTHAGFGPVLRFTADQKGPGWAGFDPMNPPGDAGTQTGDHGFGSGSSLPAGVSPSQNPQTADGLVNGDLENASGKTDQKSTDADKAPSLQHGSSPDSGTTPGGPDNPIAFDKTLDHSTQPGPDNFMQIDGYPTGGTKAGSRVASDLAHAPASEMVWDGDSDHAACDTSMKARTVNSPDDVTCPNCREALGLDDHTGARVEGSFFHNPFRHSNPSGAHAAQPGDVTEMTTSPQAPGQHLPGQHLPGGIHELHASLSQGRQITSANDWARNATLEDGSLETDEEHPKRDWLDRLIDKAGQQVTADNAPTPPPNASGNADPQAPAAYGDAPSMDHGSTPESDTSANAGQVDGHADGDLDKANTSQDPDYVPTGGTGGNPATGGPMQGTPSTNGGTVTGVQALASYVVENSASASFSDNAKTFFTALASCDDLDASIGGVTGHQIIGFITEDDSVPVNVKQALQQAAVVPPFVREAAASNVCPKCKSHMNDVVVKGNTMKAKCDSCGWTGTKTRKSAAPVASDCTCSSGILGFPIHRPGCPLAEDPKKASLHTAESKASPTNVTQHQTDRGDMHQKATCGNCGGGLRRQNSMASGWVHTKTNTKYCPKEGSVHNAGYAGWNNGHANPNFPGETTLSCPECSSTSVTMQGVHGPGGRMGDPGGGTTLFCQNCGHHQYFGHDNPKSTGARNDFSISDAKNEDGEWTMSPEQIRSEMAIGEDDDENDPYYDDFYQASRTAAGSWAVGDTLERDGKQYKITRISPPGQAGTSAADGPTYHATLTGDDGEAKPGGVTHDVWSKSMSAPTSAYTKVGGGDAKTSVLSSIASAFTS